MLIIGADADFVSAQHHQQNQKDDEIQQEGQREIHVFIIAVELED